MYVYIRSEPRLYTVGHFCPDGRWETDSDHSTQEDAGRRVAYLNGGPAPASRPTRKRSGSHARPAACRTGCAARQVSRR